MKCNIISWDTYLKDVEELKALITHRINLLDCHCIYGIPRGGLIPATILSHQLNIPYEENIPEEIPDNKFVLIVEDLCDSGTTLKFFRDLNFPMRFVSLYLRHSSKSIPDLHVQVIQNDDWLVFPYEDINSVKRDYADYIKRIKNENGKD